MLVVPAWRQVKTSAVGVHVIHCCTKHGVALSTLPYYHAIRFFPMQTQLPELQSQLEVAKAATAAAAAASAAAASNQYDSKTERLNEQVSES